MKELTAKIESLKQRRQEIDAELEAIRQSLTESLAMLGERSKEKGEGSKEEAPRPSTLTIRSFLRSPVVRTLVVWLVILPMVVFGTYALWQYRFQHAFPDRTTPVLTLTMTQTEYDLVRSAGRLVGNDIDRFDSVATATVALYAEMPSSVRDKVIAGLGDLRSVTDLPGALEDVLGRVIVTGDTVMWEPAPVMVEPVPDEPSVHIEELPPVAESETPVSGATQQNAAIVPQRRTLFRR